MKERKIIEDKKKTGNKREWRGRRGKGEKRKKEGKEAE